jgi:hypothetical protein
MFKLEKLNHRIVPQHAKNPSEIDEEPDFSNMPEHPQSTNWCLEG